MGTNQSKTFEMKSGWNILFTILLAYIAYVQNQNSNIKPIVTEVVKYEKINIPVTKTIPVNHIIRRDTTIYIYSTNTITDTIMDVVEIPVQAGETVVFDTIEVDTIGYVAAVYKLQGEMREAYYQPNIKQRVVERSLIQQIYPQSVGISLMGGYSTTKPVFAPGIIYDSKKIHAGYNYDINNDIHKMTLGYKLIHFK